MGPQGVHVMPRLAVVGVGNTFLGDEGVGYCVARALRECGGVGVPVHAVQTLSPGHVELLEGLEAVVFIDSYPAEAMPEGADVVVIEADASRLGPPDALDVIGVVDTIEPHSLDPLRLTVLARAAGVFTGRVWVLGVRVERLEFASGLSRQVIGRLPKLLDTLSSLLARLGVKVVIDRDCVLNVVEGLCVGPVLD